MRRWQNPVDFMGSRVPMAAQRRTAWRQNPAAEFEIIALDAQTREALVSVTLVASSSNEAQEKAIAQFGRMGLMFAGPGRFEPNRLGGGKLFPLFRVWQPPSTAPVVHAPPPPKPALASPVDFLAPAPPAAPAAPAPVLAPPAAPTSRERVGTAARGARTCAVCGSSGGHKMTADLATTLGVSPDAVVHPACARKALGQSPAARKPRAPKAAGPASPVDFLQPAAPRAAEQAELPLAAPAPTSAPPGPASPVDFLAGPSPESLPGPGLDLEPPPPPAGTGGKVWSPYQIAIFNDVARGRGNTQVIARAGTGKSTTILASLAYRPQGRTAIMLAFNKKIQLELEARIAKEGLQGVGAQTLNSVGYRAVAKAFRLGFRDFFDGKAVVMAKQMLDSLPQQGLSKNRQLVRFLTEVVDKSKGMLATTESEMIAVCEKFELSPPAPTDKLPSVSFEEGIALAHRLFWETTKNTRQADFNDQIWMTVHYKLPVPKFDFVFIDEAQDLNKAQIELALMCCKPGGRIISVGDPAQSIYQFRGAAEDAIPNIVARLGSKILPLTVTYRCARKIVEEAQQYVPDIEASPNAEEGIVGTIPAAVGGARDTDTIAKLVRPGDFVLSRTNAPTFALCFRLLRLGIPANIQGKDVGRGLKKLIEDSGTRTVPELIAWTQAWADKEKLRILARDEDADTSRIDDQAECIYMLAEGLSTPAEVVARIDRITTDGDDHAVVMLSNCHQAKGLERDRVFMLRDTFRPGETQEETNLTYVAVTRAKRELYYVYGK